MDTNTKEIQAIINNREFWKAKKAYEKEHYKLYSNKYDCDCNYPYCKNLHYIKGI